MDQAPAMSRSRPSSAIGSVHVGSGITDCSESVRLRPRTFLCLRSGILDTDSGQRSSACDFLPEPWFERQRRRRGPDRGASYTYLLIYRMPCNMDSYSAIPSSNHILASKKTRMTQKFSVSESMRLSRSVKNWATSLTHTYRIGKISSPRSTSEWDTKVSTRETSTEHTTASCILRMS